MTNIRVPAHSVVTIIGSARASARNEVGPIAEIASLFGDHTPVPWDINAPEPCKAKLREVLEVSGAARVAMIRTHARARTDVAAIARKRGAVSIVIRLPGAEKVDQAAEKHDAVYDVVAPDEVTIEMVPMPSDLRHITGPFDLIGDVHGCADELLELLERLGHASNGELQVHAAGRIPVLLGDLTDRGPRNKDTLEIARRLVELGGLAILGNHDHKLMRWLLGRDVLVAAGLAMTVDELSATTTDWRREMAAWLGSLQTHLVLDEGRLVVAHAGLAEKHHGRHTSSAQAFALYGLPVAGGPLDEEGYPLAEDWAQEYAGDATVVHGHVIYPEPRIVGNVVAIDTGCVFGGKLTAYRWPEREFVSVKAKKAYFDRRTFLTDQEAG